MVNGGAPHRVDGLEKVTGRTRYAAEFSAPKLAHAVLVQSPVACGRICRMDDTAARRAPGVLLVLTHQNRPPLQPLPAEYTAAFPGERRTPLEDATVHYAGQHVAVVVAETPEQAQYAAALLGLEYAYVEPALHPQQSPAKPYQPEHFAKNTAEALQSKRGVPEWVQSAYRLDLEYETPIVHHAPIEPSATLAEWDGQRLTLHDSTRWIYGTRMFVATMLGIAEEQVHVVSPYVGGAFGSKGFLWQHVVLAGLAAKLVGRPVRQVLSRAQMFTSVGHRPHTVQSIAIGADDQGNLEVLRHTSLNDTSPVAHFVEPCAMVSRHLYRCANVEIGHSVVATNISTPCFMRAPGEAPGMFALECAMDELTHSLRLDPLELRLRNDATRDDEAKRPWSSKHLRECYLQGAERFGWAQRPGAVRSVMRDGWLVGWGMATAAYPGRRAQSAVRARLTSEGQAIFATATHEIGTGTRTVIAQVAAEALGLAIERVTVEAGDSSLPPSPVHGASQATASVGPAALRAASDLRHQLFLLACSDPQSALHGATPAKLTLRDGTVMHASGDAHAEPFSDLLTRAGLPELHAEEEAKPGSEKEEFTWTSFGAHFAEVLVNAATGEVRVSRWVGVFDAGRILNPRLARAQIEGGILFGLGMALTEETLYDPHTGLPVNASLGEYLVPSCADTPEMEVHFIDVPDVRFNPLGVRGLGELGVTGAPSAIANAVFHATGQRIRQLPITPDKLFAAK